VHKDHALERKKGYYVKDGHKEKMCKAMTDGDHV
jgi:hypothetical protein